VRGFLAAAQRHGVARLQSTAPRRRR
jgi:hypothetical protein